MTAQFARAPYRGRSGGGPAGEPHAALLIDFDNVTMGIRSDLTKELKNLLNSDIIKGKVAVQRAYADWRRYPQYIVPLAESSVDLIFAPAYGSAKKNATDIRLAIDAVELVFTRPEIGTIILLSGDSDFSSLVLKLKEYGKYVIGVGIRESASDLLVQNCDEYYSYSALTGLTRAGEEAPVASEDPWELVEMALRQMIDNDDVMRSDRLKQVILDMDPAFDEKALGFQKFNKFLQEAAHRGIISLRKQENGQFEVGPPTEEGIAAAAAADATRDQDNREGRESRSRRGRRGRGRREERDREPRSPRQLELEDGAATESVEPAVDMPEAEAPAAAPEPAAAEPAVAEMAKPDRGRRPDRSAAAEQAEQAAAVAEGEAAAAGDGASGDLRRSHALLRRAMTDLTRRSGPVVRDSDVKRRMLELEAGWDESSVGFSKFSRFLRQAHDAQVITLRKGENGNYDVLLGDAEVHVEDGREERGRGRRDRGRGRDRDQRGPREAAPSDEPAMAAAGRDAPEQPAASGAGSPASSRPETKPEPRAEQPAAAAAAPSAAAPTPVGFRRGSRGRPLTGGPPPLLEGQTVGRPSAPAVETPAEVATAPAAAEPTSPTPEAVTAPSGETGGRRPGRKATKQPSAPAKEAGKPAKQTAKSSQETTMASEPERPARPAAKAAAKQAAKTVAKPPRVGFDAASFGLPTGAEAVTSYITTEYKGIGPKSVQTLVDAVGADRVFETLEAKPDQVRDLLGGARAEKLLDAWADDIAFRRANRAPTSQAPKPPESKARRPRPAGPAGRGGAPAKTPAGKSTGARRGRRGGGRRGGSGTSK
jgi:uncharacterized protein (TIGR00288 family)